MAGDALVLEPWERLRFLGANRAIRMWRMRAPLDVPCCPMSAILLFLLPYSVGSRALYGNQMGSTFGENMLSLSKYSFDFLEARSH